MEATTQVIICNQNLSLVELSQILEKLPLPKIVCSTHLFFEREIESLSRTAKENTLFFTVADFFSDSEFWEIDKNALIQVRKFQSEPGKGGYECFRVAMLRARAELLKIKLTKKFGKIKVWAVDGLGVDADYWMLQGGSIIESKFNNCTSKEIFSHIKPILLKWKKSESWTELYFQNQPVVLCCDKSRVLSRLNAKSKPVPVWKKTYLSRDSF
jgi:hypothetical protein